MIEVHVNFPEGEAAESVARAAVERRLAAAANVMAGVRSFYAWDGAVRSADEVRVVFKTSEIAADALVDFVGAAHPYRTPGIVLHKPIDMNAAYRAWIEESTGTEAE
jgi:periplasmic divalent cation tolerance protein